MTSKSKEISIIPLWRTFGVGLVAQYAFLELIQLITSKFSYATTTAPDDRPVLFILKTLGSNVASVLIVFVVSRPALVTRHTKIISLLLLNLLSVMPLLAGLYLSDLMYIDCGGPQYHCAADIPHPALNDQASLITGIALLILAVGLSYYICTAKKPVQLASLKTSATVFVSGLVILAGAYGYACYAAASRTHAVIRHLQSEVENLVVSPGCKLTDTRVVTNDTSEIKNKFNYECDRTAATAPAEEAMIARMKAHGYVIHKQQDQGFKSTTIYADKGSVEITNFYVIHNVSDFASPTYDGLEVDASQSRY